ncbi:hypothetical protein BN1723_012867, partial [Verticillium longisporum]
MSVRPPPKKKSVVFFHPDLGIGGAERLVVDAAIGLQNRGHKVTIFTSHCDPEHCFEEARNGTLDVRVRGSWPVPPHIFDRLTILCAILRQLHLIWQVYLTGELGRLRPTNFFADQLSAGLPLLQWLYPDTPIFFYCHFPDLLLARGRDNFLKRAYRVPFDLLEQWSMGFAAVIAVNSSFTKKVAADTWPSLAKRKDFKVLYPCIELDPTPPKPADASPETETSEKKIEVAADDAVWSDENIILSINRFERKKDVALAIRAFAGLSPSARKNVRLVIAGGYDLRSAENYEYHRELVALAKSLGLESVTAKNVISALAVSPQIPVLFLLSVPSAFKDSLLRSARLLVYTPANEHFGIVPLEAMRARVPVLAANTGGPVETVVDGQTGWLRDPEDVQAWTTVMQSVLAPGADAEMKRMGAAGAERVRAEFGQEKMAESLEALLTGVKAVLMVEYRAAIFIICACAIVPLFGRMIHYNFARPEHGGRPRP